MKSLLQKMTGLACLGAILITVSTSALAEDTLATPPVPELQDKNIELKTVYKYSLLPGIRLCDRDKKQAQTRTGVNCQDPELINSVSTRDREIYSLEHSTIVQEKVAPNGNILRIQFSRKPSLKN
jgi:hypothetical protein